MTGDRFCPILKTKELLVNQRSETESEAEEEAKAVAGTQEEFPNIQYYHKIPNTSDPQEFLQAKKNGTRPCKQFVET